MYDVGLGRFLQRDPIDLAGGDLNVSALGRTTPSIGWIRTGWPPFWCIRSPGPEARHVEMHA
jgi:hypothetical protein